MSDYVLVETPTFFPQECLCGSQKGPMADTGIEHAGRRLYVCTLCATRINRALGLGKGPRMTELLKSGELLDAARKDVEDRDKQIAEQLSELAARARKIEAISELLQQAHDKDRTQRAQLESINEQAKQLLQAAV